MKRLIAFYAAVFALNCFSILPRPLAYALACGAVDVYYLFDKRHRRVGLINLQIAFPGQSDAWRQRILKRSYRNLGKLVVEVSKFPKLTSKIISRRVSYSEGSLQRYLRAKEKRLGLLYLTAHISSWELLPFAHALYGHPLSFLVRPLNNPDLNRVLDSYRVRSGNRVIPKKNAIRPMLKVLKEKGDVGILIDQNVSPEEGVFAPLFGKEACTTNGLAMIALRAQAPVLPAFLLPAKKLGHYLIYFGEEVPLCQSGSVEENVRDTTARFNQVLEDIVRQYPECWLWVHKRWKTRPPGDEQIVYP
ncbi:MAG TPA: lysophospholipid acyltransferase family protein [Acidobacteriota bacterium]|jgi:KDO2-lipid IV(A) lauroyltransferase